MKDSPKFPLPIRYPIAGRLAFFAAWRTLGLAQTVGFLKSTNRWWECYFLRYFVGTVVGVVTVVIRYWSAEFESFRSQLLSAPVVLA